MPDSNDALAMPLSSGQLEQVHPIKALPAIDTRWAVVIRKLTLSELFPTWAGHWFAFPKLALSSTQSAPIGCKRFTGESTQMSTSNRYLFPESSSGKNKYYI